MLSLRLPSLPFLSVLDDTALWLPKEIGVLPLESLGCLDGLPPASLHEDISTGLDSKAGGKLTQIQMGNQQAGAGGSGRSVRESQQVNGQRLENSVLLARFGLQEN